MPGTFFPCFKAQGIRDGILLFFTYIKRRSLTPFRELPRESLLTKGPYLFTVDVRECSFPFSSKSHLYSFLIFPAAVTLFFFPAGEICDVFHTCLSPAVSHIFKEAFMNKNVTVNTEIFSSDPEISAELSEKWESLTITDRFIFAKVGHSWT